MTWWEILAVWLAGWLIAVRPSMRRVMLQIICSRCRGGACDCDRRWHEPSRARKVVRGAEFERTGGDVAHALFVAAWWPVWLTFVVLRTTLRRLGVGVKAAVLWATPLTGPELERRIAERDAEIARLTAQIDDSPTTGRVTS